MSSTVVTNSVVDDVETDDAVAAPRLTIRAWLLQDSPYIAMLLLALIGVGFRLGVGYWVVLTPVYGVICIIAGWRHFSTAQDHAQLVYSQALSWGALILAIFLLYNDGITGVLNASATSLAMMTLLALGTFTAGVQARLWRACAVGAALFVCVPVIGWVDQSAVFIAIGTLLIIGISGLVWWISQRNAQPA